MPYYDYECKQCGCIGEYRTHIDEYEKCPKCKIEMKRVIQPVNFNMGAAGAYGYYDENLGTYINTNKQRREEMKKQGVTEKIGKGWY